MKTFLELHHANDGMRNARGIANCFVVSKKILRDGKTLSFFVRTIKDPQDTGRNIVTIKPKITKKTLEAFQRSGKGKLADLPVQCFCTCKDFTYGGIAYNLSKDKNKIGVKEIRPPDIRDPGRNNHVCKHIAKVYQRYGNVSLRELYSNTIQG